MSEAKIRILVVDDHEVVRVGLASLLARQPGFEVVGEAGTVSEAIDQAARLRPDVIVMDVRLPDGSGVEACRDIRSLRPETRVLMLTSYADDEAIFASIVAGASGYLLKQTRGKALVEAVEVVGKGGSMLDPAVTQKVLDRLKGGVKATGIDSLTALNEQERKILDLIAEGKTNKEIAEEVFLSDKTVKNYVSSILSKLHLSRRSEAAAYIARRAQREPD